MMVPFRWMGDPVIPENGGILTKLVKWPQSHLQKLPKKSNNWWIFKDLAWVLALFVLGLSQFCFSKLISFHHIFVHSLSILPDSSRWMLPKNWAAIFGSTLMSSQGQVIQNACCRPLMRGASGSKIVDGCCAKLFLVRTCDHLEIRTWTPWHYHMRFASLNFLMSYKLQVLEWVVSSK